MALNLNTIMSKKVGPVPVPLIGIAVVAGGWYLYKRSKGKNATGPADSGAITSPDSGTFTGTNTINGADGSSATQTSSGPLLTGGFVGNPLGYPGGQIPGGDVYVNLPGQPPPQTTTVATSAQTYTVATGDTLSKIAGKLFGDPGFWHQLYAANASVIGPNPNVVNAGQVLTVPTIPPGSIPTPEPTTRDDEKHGAWKNGKRQHQKSGHR